MIPRRFERISNGDIDALVANGVPEGRTIDYKRALPRNTDDDKREFLADVSSLANAAGGDLVYGVREDKGVPTSADGLAGIDPDAEILRLDDSIRNGIELRSGRKLEPETRLRKRPPLAPCSFDLRSSHWWSCTVRASLCEETFPGSHHYWTRR